MRASASFNRRRVYSTSNFFSSSYKKDRTGAIFRTIDRSNTCSRVCSPLYSKDCMLFPMDEEVNEKEQVMYDLLTRSFPRFFSPWSEGERDDDKQKLRRVALAYLDQGDGYCNEGKEVVGLWMMHLDVAAGAKEMSAAFEFDCSVFGNARFLSIYATLAGMFVSSPELYDAAYVSSYFKYFADNYAVSCGRTLIASRYDDVRQQMNCSPETETELLDIIDQVMVMDTDGEVDMRRELAFLVVELLSVTCDQLRSVDEGLRPHIHGPIEFAHTAITLLTNNLETILADLRNSSGDERLLAKLAHVFRTAFGILYEISLPEDDNLLFERILSTEYENDGDDEEDDAEKNIVIEQKGGDDGAKNKDEIEYYHMAVEQIFENVQQDLKAAVIDEIDKINKSRDVDKAELRLVALAVMDIVDFTRAARNDNDAIGLTNSHVKGFYDSVFDGRNSIEMSESVDVKSIIQDLYIPVLAYYQDDNLVDVRSRSAFEKLSLYILFLVVSSVRSGTPHFEEQIDVITDYRDLLSIKDEQHQGIEDAPVQAPKQVPQMSTEFLRATSGTPVGIPEKEQKMLSPSQKLSFDDLDSTRGDPNESSPVNNNTVSLSSVLGTQEDNRQNRRNLQNKIAMLLISENGDVVGTDARDEDEDDEGQKKEYLKLLPEKINMHLFSLVSLNNMVSKINDFNENDYEYRKKHFEAFQNRFVVLAIEEFYRTLSMCAAYMRKLNKIDETLSRAGSVGMFGKPLNEHERIELLNKKCRQLRKIYDTLRDRWYLEEQEEDVLQIGLREANLAALDCAYSSATSDNINVQPQDQTKNPKKWFSDLGRKLNDRKLKRMKPPVSVPRQDSFTDKANQLFADSENKLKVGKKKAEEWINKPSSPVSIPYRPNFFQKGVSALEYIPNKVGKAVEDVRDGLQNDKKIPVSIPRQDSVTDSAKKFLMDSGKDVKNWSHGLQNGKKTPVSIPRQDSVTDSAKKFLIDSGKDVKNWSHGLQNGKKTPVSIPRQDYVTDSVQKFLIDSGKDVKNWSHGLQNGKKTPITIPTRYSEGERVSMYFKNLSRGLVSASNRIKPTATDVTTPPIKIPSLDADSQGVQKHDRFNKSSNEPAVNIPWEGVDNLPGAVATTQANSEKRDTSGSFLSSVGNRVKTIFANKNEPDAPASVSIPIDYLEELLQNARQNYGFMSTMAEETRRNFWEKFNQKLGMLRRLQRLIVARNIPIETVVQNALNKDRDNLTQNDVKFLELFNVKFPSLISVRENHVPPPSMTSKAAIFVPNMEDTFASDPPTQRQQPQPVGHQVHVDNKHSAVNIPINSAPVHVPESEERHASFETPLTTQLDRAPAAASSSSPPPLPQHQHLSVNNSTSAQPGIRIPRYNSPVDVPSNSDDVYDSKEKHDKQMKLQQEARTRAATEKEENERRRIESLPPPIEVPEYVAPVSVPQDVFEEARDHAKHETQMKLQREEQERARSRAREEAAAATEKENNERRRIESLPPPIEVPEYVAPVSVPQDVFEEARYRAEHYAKQLQRQQEEIEATRKAHERAAADEPFLHSVEEINQINIKEVLKVFEAKVTNEKDRISRKNILKRIDDVRLAYIFSKLNDMIKDTILSTTFESDEELQTFFDRLKEGGYGNDIIRKRVLRNVLQRNLFKYPPVKRRTKIVESKAHVVAMLDNDEIARLFVSTYQHTKGQTAGTDLTEVLSNIIKGDKYRYDQIIKLINNKKNNLDRIVRLGSYNEVVGQLNNLLKKSTSRDDVMKNIVINLSRLRENALSYLYFAMNNDEFTELVMNLFVQPWNNKDEKDNFRRLVSEVLIKYFSIFTVKWLMNKKWSGKTDFSEKVYNTLIENLEKSKNSKEGQNVFIGGTLNDTVPIRVGYEGEKDDDYDVNYPVRIGSVSETDKKVVYDEKEEEKEEEEERGEKPANSSDALLILNGSSLQTEDDNRQKFNLPDRPQEDEQQAAERKKIMKRIQGALAILRNGRKDFVKQARRMEAFNTLPSSSSASASASVSNGHQTQFQMRENLTKVSRNFARLLANQVGEEYYRKYCQTGSGIVDKFIRNDENDKHLRRVLREYDERKRIENEKRNRIQAGNRPVKLGGKTEMLFGFFKIDFVMLYLFKLLRLGIQVVCIYVAQKVFQEVYVRRVHAEQRDPPPLRNMLIMFLSFDAIIQVVLLMLMLAASFIYKRPGNAFVIDDDFIGMLLTEYIATWVVALAVGWGIAQVMKQKKYFEYKRHGITTSIAYRDMLVAVVVVLAVIPFNVVFDGIFT